MTRAARGLALLVVLSASHARAYELRLLAAADFFGGQAPDRSLGAAELGLQLHGDVRGLAGRIDLHVDFQDREGFVGNPSKHELRALNVVIRDLGRRLDLTIGRFAVPGGFWLFVDGVSAKLRLWRGLSLLAYGGLRAVTNARAEANLTASPAWLPLVGGALTYDHALVHAALAVTWTADVIDLPRGLAPSGGVYAEDGSTRGTLLSDKLREPELFIDASVVATPHKAWFLAGGLTFGSRYDVTYSSDVATIAATPAVSVQTLRSFMGYAIVEYRPHRTVRVSYSIAYDSVKLPTPTSPIDNRLSAESESFFDHTLKASYRVWRTLRIEARYRLRVSDLLNHRVEAVLLADQMWRGLGGFLTVGGTIKRGEDRDEASRDGVTVSGGLSFLSTWLNARVGVLYTDQIGDGLGFSAQARQALGAGPSLQLSPLSLSAQRFAFARLFGNYRSFFGGLDYELGLDARQSRFLVQVGFAQ